MESQIGFMFFLGCIGLGLAVAFGIIWIANRIEKRNNDKWVKERDTARKDVLRAYIQEHWDDYPIPPPMREERRPEPTPDRELAIKAEPPVPLSNLL